MSLSKVHLIFHIESETLMCFVMSTLQGRMLQSLLALTIWHCLLLLVMRKDTPRPQVFEQGLQEVVWVTQFLCQVSFTLDRAVRMQRQRLLSSFLSLYIYIYIYTTIQKLGVSKVFKKWIIVFSKDAFGSCGQSRSSIRKIRKLCRAPKTPGGPLALKDDFILVSFWNLASGYKNMNDNFILMSPFLRKYQSIHLTRMS